MLDAPVAAATLRIDGSPVFRNARLAALAQAEGAAAVWRTAFAQGPALIADVDGGFAVALQEPSGRRSPSGAWPHSTPQPAQTTRRGATCSSTARPSMPGRFATPHACAARTAKPTRAGLQ